MWAWEVLSGPITVSQFVCLLVFFSEVRGIIRRGTNGVRDSDSLPSACEEGSRRYCGSLRHPDVWIPGGE